jgi:hypothetical protein
VSDASLRDLERCWRETGSDEDEAAFLRARVRAHDLLQERLALAAQVDHPGARSALELEPRAEESLEAWVLALVPHGKPAVIVAGVALAELALARWRRSGTGRVRENGALAATRAWLACPCREHAQRAWSLGNDLEREIKGATTTTTLLPSDHARVEDNGEPDNAFMKAGLYPSVSRPACRAPRRQTPAAAT